MIVTINKWPITAPFASIDPSHLMPHKGVDFGVASGTPVPSVGDGIVTAVTNEGDKSFGIAVHMRLRDGTDVIYGHLSQAKVVAGQRLHANDVVGLSGSTGDSTGPHLHLQAMQHGIPVDPMAYVNPPKSPWAFMSDWAQHGPFHAITGQSPQQFAGDAIMALGQLSLGGFLIALPLACFGMKFGRRWAIRFVGAYFVLVVVGAVIRNS